MFTLIRNLWNLRSIQKRMDFKTEVLNALLKLDTRDKDLLCRALDQRLDMQGMETIAAFSRKELAKKLSEFYYRPEGKDWKVLDAFRTVIHNIRKGR